MIMGVIMVVAMMVIVIMGMIIQLVAVRMMFRAVRVGIMIMMMAFAEEVEVKVPGVPTESLLQHPDANDQDKNGGKKTKPGVEFRFRIRSGKEPGDYAQQNDAEGVGKGDNQAKQHAVNRPPPGADHVGGNQGFAMPRFKCVQGTQHHGPEIEH